MSPTESIHAFQVDRHVPIPMRDGTVLRSDVYRPQGEGKWPVIVERFVTDPAEETNVKAGTFFSQRGYVYVYNNIRGTAHSEGVFFPLINDGWGENQDGYDTIEWAARQPWSDGNVGMYGGSHGAFLQYVAAPTRPPSLKACVPIYGGAAREFAFPGGAYRLQEFRGWALWMGLNCLPGLATHEDKEQIRLRLNQAWAEIERWYRHLPLKDFPPVQGLAPWYFERLDHASDVQWWDQTDTSKRFAEVDVPILHVRGWYDFCLAGTLAHFTGLFEQGRSEKCRHAQRLIVGPWTHDGDFVTEPPAPLDFTADAIMDFNQMALRWFDYWLKEKDNGVADEPAVRVFLMGENRWLELQQWPPAGITYTPLYFRQGTGKTEHSLNSGQLTFELPNADEQPDAYLYDPKDPIIGHSPSSTINEVDQRDKEGRLLTYTAAMLAQPVVVIGPVKAVLYASSSAPDTDWVVRLCDVWPDGRSIKICDGILRARHHNPLAREQLMKPGEIDRFEIDMTATAHTFLAGHSIRIHVTSSDFPRFDRNLNTGGPFGEEVEGQVAINSISHDAQRPSHIVLPIMAHGQL